MIEKSNIEFIVNKSKPEGVLDMTNDIFPNHFLGMICGKPGSGKTSLLKFILMNENLLFKKFDYVYIISPSYLEYKCLYLPNGNFTNTLDWVWVHNKIQYIIKKHEETYTNVLFILDDVISDLFKNRFSTEILNFIFNRRHILPNGMISILITSQKYVYAPTSIRSNLNILISFKLNNIDWKKIKEEIIFSDIDFNDILNFVFNTGIEKHSFFIYRIDNNTFYKNFDKILL